MHRHGNVMDMTLDLSSASHVFDGHLTSHNDSAQVVHTCVSRSSSSVMFYWPNDGVLLRGWQSDCRSGISLAVHHRLTGITTCGLSGLERGRRTFSYRPSDLIGDEHPACASPINRSPSGLAEKRRSCSKIGVLP